MKFKTNRGITLVALVVTIVVIIILAGVTMGTLSGRNGLINQSKEQKENIDQRTGSTQNYIQYLEERVRAGYITVSSTIGKTTKSIEVDNINLEDYDGDISKLNYSYVLTNKQTGEEVPKQPDGSYTNLTQNTTYNLNIRVTDDHNQEIARANKVITTEEIVLGSINVTLSNGESYVEGTWTNSPLNIAVVQRNDGTTTSYSTSDGSVVNRTENGQVNIEGTTEIIITTTDGINTKTAEEGFEIRIDTTAPSTPQVA